MSDDLFQVEPYEVVKPAFDYSLVDAAKANRAKDAAAYIQMRQRSVVSMMLEIGGKLLEIKEDLEHGQFTQWIGAEFAWSIRSAQNYMNAARAFGGKSATVAYLPVSTVYELARVAEPIREEVVKRIQAEQLPVEDVNEIVWKAKREQKEARETARKSPEQKAREKVRKAREKREHGKWALEREEKDRARKAAENALVELIRSKFNGDELVRLIELLDATYSVELASSLKKSSGPGVRLRRRS